MNLIQFASSYTYDSGANSIDKQLQGHSSIYQVSYKPLSKPDLKLDRNDKDTEELRRYRQVLAKKQKTKKTKESRKLRQRLDKHKKPLPVRILADRERERTIQTNTEVSPIV